jgi:hypothetical protein
MMTDIPVNNVNDDTLPFDTRVIILREKMLNTRKRELSAVYTLLLIGSIPFIVCDLYYGLHDNTCVNEHIPMKITLSTYLIVSGSLSLLVLGIESVFMLMIFDFDTTQDTACIESIAFYRENFIGLCNLFKFAWTITGAVAFWKYTDISSCSDEVSGYLFAQLIIYFVSICCMAQAAAAAQKG